MNVDIVNFETTKIALIEHLGPPERVLETAAKFIAWRKETGLSPVKTSNTYGIPYSDPKTTDPEKFRWDICGTIDGDVPANDYGTKSGTIPGGGVLLFAIWVVMIMWRSPFTPGIATGYLTVEKRYVIIRAFFII